ncbi:hypothetical protein MMC10_006814 [Thelotrema lepadinum]|nr:hypothetical protein [Thelotrema lepadinum]
MPPIRRPNAAAGRADAPPSHQPWFPECVKLKSLPKKYKWNKFRHHIFTRENLVAAWMQSRVMKKVPFDDHERALHNAGVRGELLEFPLLKHGKKRPRVYEGGKNKGKFRLITKKSTGDFVAVVFHHKPGSNAHMPIGPIFPAPPPPPPPPSPPPPSPPSPPPPPPPPTPTPPPPPPPASPSSSEWEGFSD